MNRFNDACCEMNFIIENLDEKTSSKIPDKFKEFFKSNQSKKYKVNLTTAKPLYEQEMLDETKYFTQILFKLFISSKAEKEKFIADSRRLYVEQNIQKWKSNK